MKDNNRKLSLIFQKYEGVDTPEAIFLFQPEEIAIFERMEADSYKVKEKIGGLFEESYLEGLSLIWGTPLS